MTIYCLDAKYFSDRVGVHEYLSRILGFPAYYGKNLDALADCLSEMKDAVIIIENCELIVPDSYGEKILKLFDEIALSGIIKLEKRMKQ